MVYLYRSLGVDWGLVVLLSLVSAVKYCGPVRIVTSVLRFLTFLLNTYTSNAVSE